MIRWEIPTVLLTLLDGFFYKAFPKLYAKFSFHHDVLDTVTLEWYIFLLS